MRHVGQLVGNHHSIDNRGAIDGEGRRRARAPARDRGLETCDQMSAAGTRGAGADRELSGELGLARGGERVPRVADQTEYVLDTDLFEHADQDSSNCDICGSIPSLVRSELAWRRTAVHPLLLTGVR